MTMLESTRLPHLQVSENYVLLFGTYKTMILNFFFFYPYNLNGYRMQY